MYVRGCRGGVYSCRGPIVGEMAEWYDGYRFGRTDVYNLRTVFDDLSESPGAVWAQLYQTGYVTTSDTGAPNDSRVARRLRVSNLEVRGLFSEELLARATRMAGLPTMGSILGPKVP